jgi:hypothetical protein
MCTCAKPTRNDLSSSYGIEGRAPALLPGDKLLFDECGRCSPVVCGKENRIDHHSHHFRVVRAEYGGLYLLVRHGGGDERVSLRYAYELEGIFAGLDSDTRYYLLRQVYEIQKDAARIAREETANKYAKAFNEGRLKKRRRNGRRYVEIVPEILQGVRS